MHEDQQGLPFVGRAGQLLTKLLEEIGLSREEVFIANVLQSRPPGNRDPQPDEIDACKPFLHRKIELIEPRVICTLGNFSTKLLTRSQRGITGVHGRPQVHELGGRLLRVYPLFHPAAALRSTKTLEDLREDFARLPGAARGAAARAGRRRGAGGRGGAAAPAERAAPPTLFD